MRIGSGFGSQHRLRLLVVIADVNCRVEGDSEGKAAVEDLVMEVIDSTSRSDRPIAMVAVGLESEGENLI